MLDKDTAWAVTSLTGASEIHEVTYWALDEDTVRAVAGECGQSRGREEGGERRVAGTGSVTYTTALSWPALPRPATLLRQWGGGVEARRAV